jgi:hypothetical protein
MENNKIIAEFLEANPFKEFVNRDIYSYEMYGIIESIGEGEYEKHFYLPEEMLFHSDWNWLMEVVQRINITEDYRFSIQINTMDVYIHDAKNNNYIFKSGADWQPNELKKSVYEAVGYFIKWYNNQEKI